MYDEEFNQYIEDMELMADLMNEAVIDFQTEERFRLERSYGHDITEVTFA